MAIDFVKILKIAVGICQIFSVLYQKRGVPQINITAFIDMHFQFVIGPDIGSLLDSWWLLQSIILAFLS